MRYYSKDIKKSTISHIILIYVISALILAGAIYLKSIYAGICCMFLVLSNLLQKEKYISDEGVVDDYQILFLKHKRIWSFDDISEIEYEWHDTKEEVALHIMKDIMIKRFIIDIKDFFKCKELIESHNSNIAFNEMVRGKK